MTQPSTPAAEAERLAALESYSILDTEGEDAFDELARLAAVICGTPIAVISLVDATRQWFKARVGIDIAESPREISFCTHAIAEPDVFVVADALADPRFASNPLVTGPPQVRFYAGAQLVSPGGHRIGTLAVIDRVPRELTAGQAATLRALAQQVMVQLELRRQISERKDADAKLRQSEEQLQRVIEGSNDGFWDWNVVTGEVRFSRRAAAMLGFELEEWAPHLSTWTSLLHPDDVEQVMPVLQAHLDGLTASYETEHRLRRRDGGWLWVLDRGKVVTRDDAGRPIRMAGTHTDISKRKKAEEELRRSEARTRSIIDNSLGGLITTDDEGRIESVNPAALRMFGYAAGRIIGMNLCDLLESPHEHTKQCLENILGSALGRVSEWQGQRANGDTFVCELSLFEFNMGGGRRHLAGHVLDVSERQEVEQMKKDFIATVSHELRTPLTSIRGSLGLLASGVLGEMSDDARQMVAVAERNSVRLIALINDILDFEKLESGRMEMEIRPMSLARMLERSIENVAAFAAQEGVGIELSCPGVLVRGDEPRLMQVTVNLLSNAVKYSQRGGVVSVEGRVETNWTEVRVRDHGPGIAPELRGRLFQRFVQIDSGDSRAKPGTGLGLAICRAIVEQHGGVVGVESAEGEGSTFWFRIPGGPVAEHGAQAPEAGPDVIVIEDDPALLDVMSAQLAANGVRVRTAHSGAAGLAAVGEKIPGLVVLDVDLPDIDGFGVVAALRSNPRHRNLPLLVYSGLDLNHAERSRLHLGPTRFLLKSRSSDEEFRTVVDQLLDFSREREAT